MLNPDSRHEVTGKIRSAIAPTSNPQASSAPGTRPLIEINLRTA